MGHVVSSGDRIRNFGRWRTPHMHVSRRSLPPRMLTDRRRTETFVSRLVSAFGAGLTHEEPTCGDPSDSVAPGNGGRPSY